MRVSPLSQQSGTANMHNTRALPLCKSPTHTTLTWFISVYARVCHYFLIALADTAVSPQEWGQISRQNMKVRVWVLQACEHLHGCGKALPWEMSPGENWQTWGKQAEETVALSPEVWWDPCHVIPSSSTHRWQPGQEALRLRDPQHPLKVCFGLFFFFWTPFLPIEVTFFMCSKPHLIFIVHSQPAESPSGYLSARIAIRQIIEIGTIAR